MEKGRFIGIRHRVKREEKNGKMRPTQVAILEGDEIITYDLPSDTSELDWVKAEFPVEHRDVESGEDISRFKVHHIVWRKLGKGETPDKFPKNLLRQEKKLWYVAKKVPISFDGLKAGDTVAMVLGGSGDRLAYALSRRAEKIGASILRIPPAVLKDNRGKDKGEDAENLARLVFTRPDLFYRVGPRDRELIRLREALQYWRDSQKDRIKCEQRLLQRTQGRVFLSEDGFYPEGQIEDYYDSVKADDAILQALIKEEGERKKELVRIVSRLNVYTELFEPIEGCGPLIAARIIATIGDIRRVSTAPKLMKLLGVHVMPDGSFPRHRHGERGNWVPEGRQGLFLLGDQFNRRPGSYWGKRLLENKSGFRKKHPDILCGECSEAEGKGIKWVDCPKQKSHHRMYTDAHIHSMGTWRTLTKFVKWLWKEWWRIEKTNNRAV